MQTIMWWVVALAIVLVLGVVGHAFPVTKTGTSDIPTSQSNSGNKSGALCAQVVTPARNPTTGDIKEYSTPCDVPEGWEVIQNDEPTL